MLEKTLPKKLKRQAQILNELEVLPQMKVHELSERLGVSQETIRRDLAQLDKEGKISRTFGGAVGVSNVVPGIDERKNLMIAQRDRISKLTVSMLEPNDSVLVGGGSTTMRLALALLEVDFPLTIVTHSLPFATRVSKNTQIQVELLPGHLIADEGLTIGTNTLRAISKLWADKAIVGASGMNEKGLYALLEPGEIYAAMIEHADRTLMPIDSSKFDSASLALYGTWQSKLTLITDATPNARICDALHKADVTTILAD